MFRAVKGDETAMPTDTSPLAFHNSPALQPPPGVVFYRDSLYNPHARQPNNTTARCNCLAVCDGDLAEIQCMSCGVFHPRKLALYCLQCFQKRHPVYRVPHKFVPISQFENVEHVKQMRQANIEVERSVAESQIALESVRIRAEHLKSLRYSEEMGKRLRRGARQLLEMEHKLMMVRQHVAEGVVYNDQENKAAIRIQQLARGRLARRKTSLALAHQLLRLWSKPLRKWIMYDKISQKRSLYLLPKVHYDHRKYVTLCWNGDPWRAESAAKWMMCYLAPPRRRNRSMTENAAATIIQCFFWCIQARHLAVEQALRVYVRVYVADFDRFVYINSNTSVELWNKPLVLCSSEPNLKEVNM